MAVVIPAHNQAQFLAEAIDSALLQTLPPLEVIVVDDGSTDDTARVAAAFGNRITYIRQRNQGLSAARNTGIRAARADLIQLLDSDDVLHPRCLRLASEAAVRHPNAAVFAGGWDEADRDGRVFAQVDAPRVPPQAFHALFDVIAVGPASCHCVRRSAFATVGMFDTSLRACEDWDMWFRIAAAGFEFITIPEATIQYRNYATSMSKDPRLMWQSGTRVLRQAAGLHGHCAECERAQARAIARFRAWCYASMVAPRIQTEWAHRHYWAVVRDTVAALLRDPKLGPLFLRSGRACVLRGPRRKARRNIDQ